MKMKCFVNILRMEWLGKYCEMSWYHDWIINLYIPRELKFIPRGIGDHDCKGCNTWDLTPDLIFISKFILQTFEKLGHPWNEWSDLEERKS